ncbi:Ycf51 family protein [Calothrix sp. 336/3]|uniref:Ycf51 family protein n=1 Tax=Calothrix sp. 336/3 TaxID=1337936 RepID=UPI0004E46FFB|nr:Ycf51 family protein [Calothrix sp. 336/3]AKG22786.1 hypothetical protein IJ00_17245 [Calothrix sp. 336/3]
MPTSTNFIQYTQWSGIATLVFAVLMIIAFIFKLGFRFRLVGATGFMIVLTAGLFTLSLAPLTRTLIPGSVHYSLIYDNGGAQTVISVPPNINPTQLEATLQQAASDLYSYGRLGGQDNQMTIRVRTVIHPQPGLSIPLYLGQVQRSLASREDSEMAIEIYQDKLAQIAKQTA